MWVVKIKLRGLHVTTTWRLVLTGNSKRSKWRAGWRSRYLSSKESLLSSPSLPTLHLKYPKPTLSAKPLNMLKALLRIWRLSALVKTTLCQMNSISPQASAIWVTLAMWTLCYRFCDFVQDFVPAWLISSWQDRRKKLMIFLPCPPHSLVCSLE